jgi:peroxiredoxin
MRALLLATTIFVVMAPNAFAAGGLKKHDNSVATHGYNIVIDTPGLSSDGVDLKNDIDTGSAQDHVTKQPTLAAPVEAAPMAAAPAAGSPPALTDIATPVEPLSVGSIAPNITLPSGNGKFVSLSDKIAQGSALVLFIRNTSSPYDIQQLQLLQKNLAKLNQNGIQVLAVTPDPLDNIARAQAKYGIEFDILSDNTNVFAQAYGILQVAAPTPSLFSITSDGRIAAIQIQPKMSAVFDLNEAAAPFFEKDKAEDQRADAAALAAQETAAGTEQPVAPVAPPAPANQPAVNNMMPAVPSPQADKLFVPKISYGIPPSHPDYRKTVVGQGI